MSQPFRVAFIGVDHPHGAAWRESLLNLAGEVVITAIVPEFGGGLASLEETLAAVPRFGSIAELSARRGSLFDGAVVCLPYDRVPAVLEHHAAAGKHVRSEKPCGVNAAAARPALEKVRQSGVAFQTGYLWRYDEGAQRLKAMIAEGRFGKLISVEMTCVTSDANRRGPSHFLFDPEQSGGGFFNWLGCHYLDLLTYVTGQSVTAVTARTGVFGETPLGVEDGGSAIFDLSGGGLATFTGGYWLPRWAGEWRWSLRGSQRWVHWDPNRAGTSGVLEIHGPQPQFHAMEEVFSLPADRTPGYHGYRSRELIRDWLAVARGERKECRNTTASTLATLELMDAMYRSSEEGRRVAC
ncbi:MAG: Gfo/Idh/MocA family protein [Limisphaerales bacterium]